MVGPPFRFVVDLGGLARCRVVLITGQSGRPGTGHYDEQMQLERHLARTPAGLARGIAQRILAMTVGILLDTLASRPARALAVYDGP